MILYHAGCVRNKLWPDLMLSLWERNNAPLHRLLSYYYLGGAGREPVGIAEMKIYLENSPKHLV